MKTVYPIVTDSAIDELSIQVPTEIKPEHVSEKGTLSNMPNSLVNASDVRFCPQQESSETSSSRGIGDDALLVTKETTCVVKSQGLGIPARDTQSLTDEFETGRISTYERNSIGESQADSKPPNVDLLETTGHHAEQALSSDGHPYDRDTVMADVGRIQFGLPVNFLPSLAAEAAKKSGHLEEETFIGSDDDSEE